MVIITLYNSKILLSLHYFLTPQFQNFTKIFKIGRNYVSIIVNIISNDTVLQCYLLWIFVSIRRFLQLIVCIGVSTPPPIPQLKNIIPSFFLFCQAPFQIFKLSKPPFLADSLPTKKNVFSCTSPPVKIGSFSELP